MEMDRARQLSPVVSNAKGISTMQTTSFAAVGTRFVAKGMGFQNTASLDGHQAVALRVQSDMSAFYNCRIDGFHDSLYTLTHRQPFFATVLSQAQLISYLVTEQSFDFVFGDRAVIIQNRGPVKIVIKLLY